MRHRRARMRLFPHREHCADGPASFRSSGSGFRDSPAPRRPGCVPGFCASPAPAAARGALPGAALWPRSALSMALFRNPSCPGAAVAPAQLTSVPVGARAPARLPGLSAAQPVLLAPRPARCPSPGSPHAAARPAQADPRAHRPDRAHGTQAQACSTGTTSSSSGAMAGTARAAGSRPHCPGPAKHCVLIGQAWRHGWSGNFICGLQPRRLPCGEFRPRLAITWFRYHCGLVSHGYREVLSSVVATHRAPNWA